MRVRGIRSVMFVFLAGAVLAAAQNPRERSVLVTVLDASGAPIKDLKPADLSVVEDGAMREVVDVKPAAEPMTIAVLVDNTTPPIGSSAPTQELRAGLNAFVNTVQQANPETQIGIWEFAGAAVQTVKFTTKTDDLTKKIQRMFPSRQSGGVMLEALVDASKELTKKAVGPRRAIVAVSFSSAEVSTIETRLVAEAIVKSGAAFWAVTIESSTKGTTATRAHLLEEMPTRTGGLRLSGVAGTALEAQLKSIADALTAQHVVTYVRPDGAPTPKDIQAVSKRGAKALTGMWVK